LHRACYYGRTALAEFIVKKHPELLKEKDDGYWTPLHYACWRGHTALVELIVEKDSELLKEKNNCGRTPLHLACGYDRTKTIKLLLMYGADFNVVNNYGEKPLMPCSEKTQTTICNYMKELTSDVYSLFQELCKHNKVCAQKAAQFIMSMKFVQTKLKENKCPMVKIPRFIILIMLNMSDIKMTAGSIGELLAATTNEEVNQLITKWTTKDKK
jgi:hypothetical protein